MANLADSNLVNMDDADEHRGGAEARSQHFFIRKPGNQERRFLRLKKSPAVPAFLASC
jgi:hypothetical protein